MADENNDDINNQTLRSREDQNDSQSTDFNTDLGAKDYGNEGYKINEKDSVDGSLDDEDSLMEDRS